MPKCGPFVFIESLETEAELKVIQLGRTGVIELSVSIDRLQLVGQRVTQQ